MKIIFVAATALLALSACSVTVPAMGLIGKDNDAFAGSITGYTDRTGTIEMESPISKRRCTGNYWDTSANGGEGRLSCSDGTNATIQYVRRTLTTGYGFGRTSAGEPIKFTFGLSYNESRSYLN